MDGIILNSVLTGKRIQKVSEAFEMGVGSTDELLTKTDYHPSGVLKPTIFIGERVLDYKTHIVKTNIGMLASSVSVSYDPHYSILNRHMVGTRTGYDGANFFPTEIEFAEQVHKTNTGISTYGIGYTPVISDTATKSELRRWPRNWFGDNIKN